MAKTPQLTRQEDFEAEQPNFSKVGDVIQSMLTEAQFQAERDGTWVLMDGRDITGSAYATITGNTILPDARGQFLRGKNNGRADGQEDPAGERDLGNQQEDAFQGHVHRYDALDCQGNGNNSFFTHSGTGNPLTIGTGNFVDHHEDGVNGTPRTDEETRPKNITINYFIKINN